jgi:hypothetical protein
MTKQDSQPTGDAPAICFRDPRFTLGQSIGLAAFIWGYPLVETIRTCRLQILAGDDARVAWRAPIDRLQHVQRASTSADRDVVTPANDLLYTTGWINLDNGPRMLQVPSSKLHHGRYFVLALYDAWTENFENPGRRSSPPDGEMLLLVGPNTPVGYSAPNGMRLVRASTNLVWVIARVVVGEGADVQLAQALQAEIRLECPSDSDSGRPPAAVDKWVGAPQDTLAALQEHPQDAQAIAGAFFNNLCLCLADAPPSLADRGLADWFQRGKLVAGLAFDWARLDAPLRAGLQQGLVDGAALVVAQSRSQVARPWAAHYGLGRYGTNYLTRALTAYKGLGALASDEAVYAMGDFDADKQPLDGRYGYLMRFESGQMPPVDAFWSVTLYAADRFLYANPAQRYSIGDRTEGLRSDPDGGLTLRIGHVRPSDPANWLPAPASSFYLILRMYSPLPDTRSWHMPPLKRIAQSAPESTLP